MKKVLKFNLTGEFAFFKKPDVNVDINFTYGQIHKVAILGILGACLGLKGYAQQEKENLPEFYKKLKEYKVAIVPKNENSYIEKFIHIYNNSTGHASHESGGNLIIKEQWLRNPKWTIYVELKNDEISCEIERRFIELDFDFIPYIGKNDFLAEIENICIINLEKRDCIYNIDSLFKSKDFELIVNKDSSESEYIYTENLPIGITEDTNHYIFENIICTNLNVNLINENVNLYFDSSENINLVMY